MDCQEMFYSDEYSDYILELSGVEGEELLLQADCVTKINDSYAQVQVFRNGEDEESQFLNFRNLPRMFGLLEGGYLEETGVLKLQRNPELDLFGQGVILGIVDTGIDYRHPAFVNEDNTTRIGVLWDQSIPSGEPDVDFPYGSIYDKELIDKALASDSPYDVVPSVDEEGHGTFLAGIAGGRKIEEESFTGVAPLCELAVVKLKGAKEYLRRFWMIPEGTPAFQETDLFQGIRFIETYAKKRKKPYVLLLGCGTNSGNHGEGGYLKNYLNHICSFSGKCIVLPAGNEGNLARHFRGNGLLNTQYFDVEFQAGEKETGFFMELWAKAPDLYTVGFISPGGEYTQKIPLSVTEEGIETGFVFENTKITVYYEQVERTSGSMLIFMRFQNPTPGIWKIRVFKERVLTGRYDIWLPLAPFLLSDTFFLQPDPDTTICEPGNARNPITVTASDDRENTLYFQAGRGYTSEGDVKPDVAAPGVNLTGPSQRGGLRTMTGTSAAAAVCAGCAVLLFSYRNYYTGTQIKNLLIRGAKRKQIAYPNPEWGYGEADVYQSLSSLRNLLTLTP